VGSPAIAAWIAHVAFWMLLAWGWAIRELGVRAGAIFLLLWLTAFIGLPYVPYGAALFSSYVALLDVVLVLMIFKGDIPLG
jgi:hypothetical protein